MRTLVIADIHGSYKCLIEVLEKAGPADRVIFLGDYVDGLPENYEVVEHIRNMPSAVCIRGNHDQWTLEWLSDAFAMGGNPFGGIHRPVRGHYDQGGRATYESYAGRTKEERETHRDFLDRTLPYFIDEQNRVFVHGGFSHDPREESIDHLMWDRELMEDAYKMERAYQHGLKHNVIDPSSFEMPGPYNKFKEIYIGHTATKFFTNKEEPANWLNLWAMDTNCGWGGPLVAMDVDTKEIFYSRPGREHYPDFKGR